MVRAASGLRAAFDGMEADLDEDELSRMRRRLRLAATTPALRPSVQAGTAATAAAVAAALAEGGADAGEADVAATAALAGLTEALLAWSQSPHASAADLGRVLRRACDILGGAR